MSEANYRVIVEIDIAADNDDEAMESVEVMLSGLESKNPDVKDVTVETAYTADEAVRLSCSLRPLA